MITKEGIYTLKEEFFKENNIPHSQYKTRKEDLLEWLKEFYEYKILEGKPLRIQIIEVIGEYKPLPRKKQESRAITEQKQKDYEDYVRLGLSKEFSPESKCHMARKAIGDFGEERYGHISDIAVARRYVGPAMEKLGEHSETYYWVDFDTYKKLSPELLNAWLDILRQEHIGQEEAANAFYKQEQGEDITKEKKAYQKALETMKKQYHIIPVKVAEWRLRNP